MEYLSGNQAFNVLRRRQGCSSLSDAFKSQGTQAVASGRKRRIFSKVNNRSLQRPNDNWIAVETDALEEFLGTPMPRNVYHAYRPHQLLHLPVIQEEPAQEMEANGKDAVHGESLAPLLPELDAFTFEPLNVDVDQIMDGHGKVTAELETPDNSLGNSNAKGHCASASGTDELFLRTNPQELPNNERSPLHAGRHSGIIQRRKAVRKTNADTPRIPQKWQADTLDDFKAASRYANLFENTKGRYVTTKTEGELQRADSWEN